MSLRIVSSGRFSKWERAMAGAVVLVAVAAVFLGAPGEAAADPFCTWNIHCEATSCENPWDPSTCIWDCEISGSWCQPSSGDCESMCDEQKFFCEADCIDQGGTPLDCGRLCRTVFRACNQSCVPNI